MPNTPAASPTVSSTIGLKNVVIAPLVEDTETTLTYGDLQSMIGAIDASITPSNTDPEVQYCDDAEFDTLYPDPELARVNEIDNHSSCLFAKSRPGTYPRFCLFALLAPGTYPPFFWALGVRVNISELISFLQLFS